LLRPAPRRRTRVGEEVEAALCVQADPPSLEAKNPEVTHALGRLWVGFVGAPFAEEEGEEEVLSMLFPLFEEDAEDEDENIPPMIPAEDDTALALAQSLAGLSLDLEEGDSSSQPGGDGEAEEEEEPPMLMPPLAFVPDTEDEDDSSLNEEKNVTLTSRRQTQTLFHNLCPPPNTHKLSSSATMKFTQEMFHHYQTKGMPPAVQGVSLTDQVVVVTGANTGLGYEAAKHFALILVCRSEMKGLDAVNQLKAETGFQNVDLWVSDLTSFESVTSVKDKIDALERLDILVENAGVAMDEYVVTKDDWEIMLHVNLLSTALRIILHVPKLTQTAKKYPETVPRIVYVSSGSHYRETISSEAINAANTLKFINAEVNFPGEKRYPESKILGQTFMRALQTHLPTVTCCSVGPGFCESRLDRHVKGERAEEIRNMKANLAYTSEEGGRQLLYAAIGERDKEDQVRGAWLAYSEILECSDFILGEEGQKLQGKVWKEVLEVVGSVDGKAENVIEEYLA
ncbi:hypothetical protein V5O48_010840, partial [Marasmius crinis-equi]